VASQWEYRTFLVKRHQPVGGGTSQRPRYDWVAAVGDARWEGWEEILRNLGGDGWEIITVVIEDQSENSVATTGRTETYRVFCKRPA